ncbi:MAG: DNA-3-methyladenine glycosylase 2 family protein [Rhizobiaceae bacterium]|nr:DNA-3-methyladenine glycosylase 2 family protein [Rhizobiaceae bacterium]
MSRIKTIQDVDNALAQLVEDHPELARALHAVNSAGMKVPLRLRPAGFEGLSQIVISQLVSKAAANAIHQRFISHITPLTPQTYLDAGEKIWRTIGLSRPKQVTLSAISTAIINNELDLKTLGEKRVDDAISHLTAIKGIGPWTAHVYLLFCVGHSDIFPSGDLALREAARVVFSMKERPTAKELDTLARQWSPRRGVAARLLWSLYAAKKAGRDATP